MRFNILICLAGITLLLCSCTSSKIQVLDTPRLSSDVSKIQVTLVEDSPEFENVSFAGGTSIREPVDIENLDDNIKNSISINLLLCKNAFKTKLIEDLKRNGFFVISEEDSVANSDLKVEVNCRKAVFSIWAVQNVQTGNIISKNFGGFRYILLEIAFIDNSGKTSGKIQIGAEGNNEDLRHSADEVSDYIKKMTSEKRK